MSIQENKVKKDKYIQIRVDVNTKAKILKLADDEEKTMSEYILESVLTGKNGVNTYDKNMIKRHQIDLQDLKKEIELLKRENVKLAEMVGKYVF